MTMEQRARISKRMLWIIPGISVYPYRRTTVVTHAFVLP